MTFSPNVRIATLSGIFQLRAAFRPMECQAARARQSQNVMRRAATEAGTHRYSVGMANKPEPTKPIPWDIYLGVGVGKTGLVGMLLGTVEAAYESEAIAKGAEQFNKPATKLMAVPRG
jgi:hypothetical protein